MLSETESRPPPCRVTGAIYLTHRTATPRPPPDARSTDPTKCGAGQIPQCAQRLATETAHAKGGFIRPNGSRGSRPLVSQCPCAACAWYEGTTPGRNRPTARQPTPPHTGAWLLPQEEEHPSMRTISCTFMLTQGMDTGREREIVVV